jgi:hypothetical protein
LTSGNHPGYVLGCWLRDYARQVQLLTSGPAVERASNVSEQGAKAAKRHQAISGYWHTQATAARWCRNRSYLDSAAAHGIIALDAITAALASTPRLPLRGVATATGNRSSRMPVKGHRAPALMPCTMTGAATGPSDGPDALMCQIGVQISPPRGALSAQSRIRSYESE